MKTNYRLQSQNSVTSFTFRLTLFLIILLNHKNGFAFDESKLKFTPQSTSTKYGHFGKSFGIFTNFGLSQGLGLSYTDGLSSSRRLFVRAFYFPRVNEMGEQGYNTANPVTGIRTSNSTSHHQIHKFDLAGGVEQRLFPGKQYSWAVFAGLGIGIRSARHYMTSSAWKCETEECNIQSYIHSSDGAGNVVAGFAMWNLGLDLYDMRIFGHLLTSTVLLNVQFADFLHSNIVRATNGAALDTSGTQSQVGVGVNIKL